MDTVFELQLARHDANFHAQELWRLEAALLDRPDRLVLRLGGQGGMPPESALAYCDLLETARGEGTRVITLAYTPLLAADVIVWLAGDVRGMQPSAWLYVPSLPEEFDAQRDDGKSIKVIDRFGSGATLPSSYPEVLQRLEVHLLMPDCLDRRIAAIECRELGLTGLAMDRLLKDATQFPSPDQPGPTDHPRDLI